MSTERYEQMHQKSGDVIVALIDENRTLTRDLATANAKNAELEARLAAIDVQPVVAWVTPLHYGSAVTFYKPNKPEGWDLYDDEKEWYCKPLIAKPASNPDTVQEKQS